MTPELRALLERHPAPWTSALYHWADSPWCLCYGRKIRDANHVFVDDLSADAIVHLVNAAASEKE